MHSNQSDGRLQNEDKVSTSWLVPSHMHGLRADQYLKRRIGRISRARVQSIIESSDFMLDNVAVKKSSRVKGGQTATLKRWAPDASIDVDGFTVEIVFDSDDLLVVNKPPGLSIHPSANCLYKTLTHWLRKNYPGQKINPCHRLDKETSGLLICAKNRLIESKIKRAFMLGLVKKTYLAIVNGVMSKSTTVAIPLALQGERGLVAIRMIKDDHGKPAITKARPVRISEQLNRSLVLCRPLTGRQHQIRAHLSLIGHPIVGDKLYEMGDEYFDQLSKRQEVCPKELAHPRHALHAARLRLRLGNECYTFFSHLPNDLAGLIATP